MREAIELWIAEKKKENSDFELSERDRELVEIGFALARREGAKRKIVHRGAVKEEPVEYLAREGEDEWTEVRLDLRVGGSDPCWLLRESDFQEFEGESVQIAIEIIEEERN